MDESYSAQSLKEIDFKYLWHPFTQAKTWFGSDPLIIERGEGVELIDIDGRRYLDGVSSLWCNVHGHNVPELVDAIKSQAERICHSTLLGLTHKPILRLTEKLMRVVPQGLSRVFYCDSGSTAVEAALRMALEWWQKQSGDAGKAKRRFVSLEGAYHGDTLGAVGVGYLDSFHHSLLGSVTPALRVPPPHHFRFFENKSAADALDLSLAALRGLLEQEAASVAAMIIEPMVQGAAGMWTQPAEYLSAVAELCRKHDVLLICDEVATGFGKTGKLFATEHAAVSPDMLVLAKGLSAGYLPISAVVTSERIFAGFYGDPEEGRTFYYGQTFAGNPLAAEVASANLDLFSNSSLMDRIPARAAHLQYELERSVARLPHVDEIRSCGMMVGVELTAVPGKRVPFPAAACAGQRIAAAARRLGAVIRPLGNVIVLMPPLTMEKADLTRLVKILNDSIVAALGE